MGVCVPVCGCVCVVGCMRNFCTVTTTNSFNKLISNAHKILQHITSTLTIIVTSTGKKRIAKGNFFAVDFKLSTWPIAAVATQLAYILNCSIVA